MSTRHATCGYICAWPIGYGSTAHRYDCAPYSLNTVSVVKIEHRSFVHRINCARAIRHESVMHRYKWAPERSHTPFSEQVGTREFSTKLAVHHRLNTVQLHTSETGHRFDWARAQLCTVLIEHEHKCVPYRLSMSTTVHRYNCAPRLLFFRLSFQIFVERIFSYTLFIFVLQGSQSMRNSLLAINNIL